MPPTGGCVVAMASFRSALWSTLAPLLPAVPRDWRGFFWGLRVPDRLAVFLDYQNVHMTAHGLFEALGSPAETSLVHPLLIAERIAAKRRGECELVSVRVFRGRPNPVHHPVPTAANDAQTSAWERDSRVKVFRRALNYRGWPEHPPREKGVDVALAVDLIEGAMLGNFDVGVVFSNDTDLMPAVETAFRRTSACIEVASWTSAKPLWFPEYISQGRYLPYCHFLNQDDFQAVRDHGYYV